MFLNNNFVDDSKFDIKPVFENKGYFLYVGRLSKEKGCHYLLEAMSKLDDKVELHIVGYGNEEENLKEQAKKLNLKNVHFLGFRTGSELEEEFKNCIATILPCNWFESFGLTIVESFVYGKPAIASKVGGIPELVENNETGIVFEPGNVEELTLAINRLSTNPELAVQMGQKARIKAETLYRQDLYYSKLIEIYNSAIYGNTSSITKEGDIELLKK